MRLTEQAVNEFIGCLRVTRSPEIARKVAGISADQWERVQLAVELGRGGRHERRLVSEALQARRQGETLDGAV